MTVKDFLKGVYKQGLYLRTLKTTKEKLLEDIASPKAMAYDDVKVDSYAQSDLSDKLLQIYAERDRLSDKILQTMAEVLERKKKAMELINRLPSYEERVIMMEHYLNCKKWDDIAREIHYSSSSVFFYHGMALNALRDMTNDSVILEDTDSDESLE